MIIVGVDTGGTFTDFVIRQGDKWLVYKSLSTPSNPAEAVLAGLSHIAGKGEKKIIHGTTVATNAILERKGARTALITNKGFEDIIEIGRQDRKRLYDLAYQKSRPIIPSNLRYGIKGRIIHTGEEIEPFDPGEIQGLIKELKDKEVASIAVCLLFAFNNPDHEKQVSDQLKAMGIPISLSYEILSEFREYERTSTTAINAYVSPIMADYIGDLIKKMGPGNMLSIMQSNGGSLSGRTAMEVSVRTILSGPAGGAVGAHEMGKMAGYPKLITFDMGGTSTDVCLIDNKLSLTTESRISGYPIKIPVIDIHTVGAGGGSIASLDIGGSLKVGPESAGADPGPVCYGRGEQITVTDANLYLGRLIPEHFLGGNFHLQTERLEQYFTRAANKAGLSQLELAEGIITVANTAMEKAIRMISVERGHDPRDFALFSFGGAGGMHAAFLAALLGIPSVIIPPNPGVVSAMGMLMADMIKDYSATVMRHQADAVTEELEHLFLELEKKGLLDLFEEGIPEGNIVLERYLDMRYKGQSFEIIVPFDREYVEDFHRLHEQAYGYHLKGKAVEIVNIRLRARGIPDKPEFPKKQTISHTVVKDAFLGTNRVFFDQKPFNTRIVRREKLSRGNRLSGPAVVVEYSSTIVIPPHAEMVVDEYENLILEIS